MKLVVADVNRIKHLVGDYEFAKEKDETELCIKFADVIIEYLKNCIKHNEIGEVLSKIPDIYTDTEADKVLWTIFRLVQNLDKENK